MDRRGPAYYDFDAIGSTAGITNAAGAYVNRYSYLPFGETTVRAAGVANPFTYVGQFGVTADGNGLLRMGFRNYDGSTGQFISMDPIRLERGDVNLQRYVRNNPATLIDPSGLTPQDDLNQLIDRIHDLAKR